MIFLNHMRNNSRRKKLVDNSGDKIRRLIHFQS